MKNFFMGLWLVAFLGPLPFELPQEIPTLENVVLRATVTRSSDVYSYSYRISNGQTSTGQIWIWGLDIRQPLGGEKLGGEGLLNGPRFHNATSQANLTDPSVPEMVPVGVSMPPDWSGGLSAEGSVAWNSQDAPFNISAGQSLEGFVLSSRGLPGIRGVGIHPRFRLAVEFDQIKTQDDEEAVRKRQAEIKSQIAVLAKTVGPTAPPKNFVPIEFLNYLIALVHESRQQGWIKVDGVRDSLLAKLITAKRKLEAGDINEAKNALSAFLNEVGATSCDEFSCPGNKPETSEAYALLFFNGQFLFDRL